MHWVQPLQKAVSYTHLDVYKRQVLTSVGLPVDGIALVAGVDRIFDMGRTVVNITGDASCCVVVHNLEKKKEMKNNQFYVMIPLLNEI